MRALAIAAAVLAIPVLAAAQQNPPSPNPAPAASQKPSPQPTKNEARTAPVGHRQPTQESVPPSVQREETSGQRVSDPLGPLPQICRDC
jgi:hypothetical protein